MVALSICFFKEGPLLGAQTIPQTICDDILTQTSPGAVSHPYLLAQEVQIDMEVSDNQGYLFGGGGGLHNKDHMDTFWGPHLWKMAC